MPETAPELPKGRYSRSDSSQHSRRDDIERTNSLDVDHARITGVTEFVLDPSPVQEDEKIFVPATLSEFDTPDIST